MPFSQQIVNLRIISLTSNLRSSTTKSKTETSGFVIERTAKRMKHSFQKLLKNLDAGITVDQWVILQLLYDDGVMSQLDIGENTNKDAPTVTRIIDLLCSKGLAERKIDPVDRRKFNIHLTELGIKRIEKLLPEVREFRLAGYRGISDEELGKLMRTLNRIYINFE